MDTLHRAAEAYGKLVNMNAEVTLSNGYAFLLCFRAGNFHHLAGIHKLKDLIFS